MWSVGHTEGTEPHVKCGAHRGHRTLMWSVGHTEGTEPSQNHHVKCGAHRGHRTFIHVHPHVKCGGTEHLWVYRTLQSTIYALHVTNFKTLWLSLLCCTTFLFEDPIQYFVFRMKNVLLLMKFKTWTAWFLKISLYSILAFIKTYKHP